VLPKSYILMSALTDRLSAGQLWGLQRKIMADGVAGELQGLGLAQVSASIHLQVDEEARRQCTFVEVGTVDRIGARTIRQDGHSSGAAKEGTHRVSIKTNRCAGNDRPCRDSTYRPDNHRPTRQERNVAHHRQGGLGTQVAHEHWRRLKIPSRTEIGRASCRESEGMTVVEGESKVTSRICVDGDRR